MTNFKFIISNDALSYMDEFLSKRKAPKTIRIGSRQKNNCSNWHGFVECADYVSTPNDIVIRIDGIFLVISKQDQIYINNSVLSFIKTDMATGLKITNARKLCQKFACR